MKILVKANIDGKTVDCRGTIEIHWTKEPQAYVSWRVFSPTTTLVSKSENFHYKDTSESKEKLINKIVERILSCKIGRKRIFEEVRIFEE